MRACHGFCVLAALLAVDLGFVEWQVKTQIVRQRWRPRHRRGVLRKAAQGNEPFPVDLLDELETEDAEDEGVGAIEGDDPFPTDFLDDLGPEEVAESSSEDALFPQSLLELPPQPLSSFQVGQIVQGRVKRMIVGAASLAYVDIGAAKDAVLEFGEMTDGFPRKVPVHTGKKVEARVLEYSAEIDRLYLTRRTGDLKRPPRIWKEDQSRNPEPLRRVAQQEFLDAEVINLITFGAFVNVYPSWGDKTPVFALLHKTQFAPGFADNPEQAIRGGRIKVRKLAINANGELQVTMKQ